MVRWPAARPALTPAEEFGLALLVDLARLVPMDDATADVVQLVVVPGGPDSLAALGGTGGIGGGWGLERGDGEVRIPRAILGLVTEVASAAAEQRSCESDRHGRVPSSVNTLVEAGLEREPVISRAAGVLRDAVLAAAGRRAVRLVPPWPEGRRWAAAFTHDLDVVAWWPLFAGARAAELARKGEQARLFAALGAALRSLIGDPVLDGVRWLLDLERELGIASTWFVLCGTPTPRTFVAGDLTYTPESRRARAVFEAVLEGGHEIGLHGSFATMESTAAFAEQRARLAGILGCGSVGVRQHFLRMRPGTTQRAMEQAGFRYDATQGFPDRNGFRLGVADVVPAWDAAGERATPVAEVPLVWMDRALSKYQRIEDPAAWVEDGLELARASRAVDGLWVGLWHPNLTAPLGFPGAPDAYQSMARSLVEWDPYIAPLERLVAWRAARRSVRAERILPDGSVLASSTESLPGEIVLEDGSARRFETVTA